MNDKSIILFAGPYVPRSNQAVRIHGSDKKVFVRAVTFNGNIDRALDCAHKFMRRGETVLNTIPMP